MFLYKLIKVNPVHTLHAEYNTSLNIINIYLDLKKEVNNQEFIHDQFIHLVRINLKTNTTETYNSYSVFSEYTDQIVFDLKYDYKQRITAEL